MHISRPCLSSLICTLAAAAFLAGCSSTSTLQTAAPGKTAFESVKPGRFDGGRMWTFEDPPLSYFAEEYHFKPDTSWFNDVRLAALRYSGCSASFVSGDGLVMTNHHCVRQNLMAVQKEGEKLLETGFYAARLEDERKIPNAYLDQLVEIRDVTAGILSAMDTATTDERKVEARRKVIAAIQERAEKETGLRAQVVMLYNGGKYSLYLYRRYTDVRLVFAPELQAAHFGGEYDNFTYPRYAFDCAFLRVYENDAPLRSGHFFHWNSQGAKEGELVFVVGNPGRTGRLRTVDQLEYNRDFDYPFTLRLLEERMNLLQEYIAKYPQKKDTHLTQLLGISNGWKSYKGRLDGLRDNTLLERRRAFDHEFRKAVQSRPDLASKYGHLWTDISSAIRRLRSVAPENYGLRTSGLGVADLYSRACALVLLHHQRGKEESARMEAYRQPALPRTIAGMRAVQPVDEELEALTLTRQLRLMKDYLGAGDPIVRYALQGRTEEQAARTLVSQSRLKDSAYYVSLIEDSAAVENSDDPFIAMARMAYPRLERTAEIVREAQAKLQVNSALLGRALYDLYGTSIPPDATFTLRIADGIVKGYEYNGTKAPPHTTFYGLYDRYYSFRGEESWELAPRWKNPPPDLPLATPMNFASTNDIIGGNSGSPVINTQKEIVGLVFDGNIESLPGDFIFAEDKGNRTVSVHSAGILEGLRYIYKAHRIVTELETGARTK
ncbi:MAG: S46 family peptidase [Bacteroidota bacterium]|nr:S46 family peptidase [Bacteroidota bacterium]